MKAISMIRFSGFPDSLGNIGESDIDSVTLTLPVLRYAYGDTSNWNNLSFKVYKIIKYWDNKTNWDSLFPSGGNNTDYFDNSKVLGSYSGYIDTVKPLTLNLDKQLIIDWFKLSADTLTDSTIWGIAIVPDESSSVIRTFSSQTLTEMRVHPYIRVSYKRTADTLDTLIFQSAIDASVTNSNPPDENTLTLQGGISSRFKIGFNIDTIPDESAIHVAELILHINRAESMPGNYNIDSTLSASLFLDSTYTSYFSYYTGGRDSVNKNIFKFPSITSAVQYWVSHGKKGELVFYAEGLDNEYRELDKLVFHGLNDPEPSKRPLLRIIYSTRPKFGVKR